MKPEREIARIQRLQALGIQPLVARRVLPGAAPSRYLRLRNPPADPRREPRPAAPAPEPAGRPPGKAPPRRTGAAGSVPEAQVRALRDSLGSPGSPDSERAHATGAAGSAPGAERASARQGGAPAQRIGAQRTLADPFSLAVVIAGGRLWVEDLAGAPLAREQVELIGAMARALHHPQTPGERPLVTQFDWPLHSNAQLDLGPEEAAVSLGSFLDRQAGERDCAAIVCLGEAAAGRLAGLRLTCATVPLPATREMLADPARKREAWERLCP